MYNEEMLMQCRISFEVYEKKKWQSFHLASMRSVYIIIG